MRGNFATHMYATYTGKATNEESIKSDLTITEGNQLLIINLLRVYELLTHGLLHSGHSIYLGIRSLRYTLNRPRPGWLTETDRTLFYPAPVGKGTHLVTQLLRLLTAILTLRELIGQELMRKRHN